jgi:hypothetical protein
MIVKSKESYKEKKRHCEGAERRSNLIVNYQLISGLLQPHGFAMTKQMKL